MIDYSIAAIPTEYKGRMYRSRLEARWAAFFDRLGLAHEYEPFDLGAWSPDFLLTDINTLVEVKPLTEFAPDVWAKMVGACKERGLLSGDGQINALFLSMVAPRKHDRLSIMRLGWIAMPWRDQEMEPLAAYLGWTTSDSAPEFLADITATITGGICTTDTEYVWEKLTVLWAATLTPIPQTYFEHSAELWARASSGRAMAARHGITPVRAGRRRCEQAAVVTLYWSDWADDPALALCSLAAQGLWMRLLCIAAQGTPYGHVTVNGKPPSMADLAKLIRPRPKMGHVERLVAELVRNGVVERDTCGCLVSRRMEIDGRLAAARREAARKRWEDASEMPGGIRAGTPARHLSGGKTVPAKPQGRPTWGLDLHMQNPRFASTELDANAYAKRRGFDAIAIDEFVPGSEGCTDD